MCGRLMTGIGFALAFASTVHGAELVGKSRVIDGDTIEIAGERIRLHGIDAPEAKQTCAAGGKVWTCGREATAALTAKIGRNEVTCRGQVRDRYRRLIAVCYITYRRPNLFIQLDLNAFMVRKGWALAYRRYSNDYVDEEAEAKAERAGMWLGEFLAPWDWRRKKK